MTEVRNINFNYEKDSVLYSGPWKYLNTCHRINLSIYYMYYITVGIILVKFVISLKMYTGATKYLL